MKKRRTPFKGIVVAGRPVETIDFIKAGIIKDIKPADEDKKSKKDENVGNLHDPKQTET